MVEIIIICLCIFLGLSIIVIIYLFGQFNKQMEVIVELETENRTLIWEVEAEQKAVEDQKNVNKELTEKLKEFQFSLTKLSQHVKTS